MTRAREPGAGQSRRGWPTSRARSLTTVSQVGSRQALLRPRDRPLLFVLQGREQGAVFPIPASGVLVGREATADVTLTDDTVSRDHARLSREDACVYLEDMSSLNGTFVNEQRLEAPVRLESGDQLRFGDNTIVKFALVDELEERALCTLYELSARDPLTRLYNRRYFDDRLTSELAYARRHGSSVALLLIDLDYFKRVNDNYGHQVGDAVLRRVASELGSVLRPEDVLARYGGEEFIVIARNISKQSAEALGERIRHVTEQIDFSERALKITASVGIAYARATATPNSAELLIGAADDALYRAKGAGRNCVRLAEPLPQFGVPQQTSDTIPPASA